MTESVVKKQTPPPLRGRCDAEARHGLLRRARFPERVPTRRRRPCAQSFAARASGDASIRFAMRGVMKIRSSVFLRLTDLFLNSQPSPGIFDSPGTPAWVTESFSL